MSHSPRIGRLGLVALGLGLLTFVPGCMGLQVSYMSLENPSLTVGASSKLLIEASTLPGRTLTYTARAQRGRVLPEGATTNKVLHYYAPYTSGAPDQTGNRVEGDTIEVQVTDGSTNVLQKVSVNLSGSTMVYVEGADANGYGALKLATTDESGTQVSNVRTLTDGSKNALRGAAPAIAPNGRMIAFVDYSAGSSNSAIRTIDSAGRLLTVVSAADTTGFNVDPSWAPNSQELVFASDRRGNFDLYRVSALSENSAVTAITQTSQAERYPAWNPSFSSDRMATAIVSAQTNSRTGVSDPTISAWNLFVIDLTSGQYLKQLTDLNDPRDYAGEARWRRDGQVIAYTRYGPYMGTQADSQRYQRIYLQDTTQNAGSGKMLNQSEQNQTVFESNPVWNQMGTAILYVKSFSSPTVAAQTNQAVQGQLWRQNVNGVNSVSEVPQQWQDFGAQVPGLGFHGTQRRMMGGNGVNWY